MVTLYGFGPGVLWETVGFISIAFWEAAADLALDAIGAVVGGWFAGQVIRRQGIQQVA